jgi:hypothetical protein
VILDRTGLHQLIVARRLALDRGRHQTRTRQSAGVDRRFQRHLDALGKGTTRIGTGESVIEQHARIASGVQHQIIVRQLHAWHEAFHRRWPGQVGVSFD